MLVLSYIDSAPPRGRYLTLKFRGAWILDSDWHTEAEAVAAAQYLRSEFMVEARVALRRDCEIVVEASR